MQKGNGTWAIAVEGVGKKYKISTVKEETSGSLCSIRRYEHVEYCHNDPVQEGVQGGILGLK